MRDHASGGESIRSAISLSTAGFAWLESRGKSRWVNYRSAWTDSTSERSHAALADLGLHGKAPAGVDAQLADEEDRNGVVSVGEGLSGAWPIPWEDAVERTYHDQITNLQSECASPEFLTRLFGIAWPPEGEFQGDFRAWEAQRLTRGRCKKGLISRWGAEHFLQDHRLQPLPWASASLGMTKQSLAALLPELPRAGLRRRYDIYPELIDKSLSEDLVRSLKGMRFRTFSTHNSFCTILHDALRAATAVAPEPWYCATSLRLGEYERLFASVIDSVTGEGLSVKHSVWLKLGKPLSLPPDRCSKLFYAENRESMRDLIAGLGEPDDLPSYLQWLAEHETAGHG